MSDRPIMLNIKHLTRSCHHHPILARLFKSSALCDISKHSPISFSPNTAQRQFSTMESIKPWADGPFKMIPTPLFTQGPDKTVDQYVTVASQMAIAHNTLIRALNRHLSTFSPSISPQTID